MKLINLTPHDIQLIYQDPELDHESIDIIPASGILARCDVLKEAAGMAGPVPVYNMTYGPVQGLPDPQADTAYIVSSVVAQSVAGTRDDVLVPIDFVRDDQGQITGCRGLGRLLK